MRDITLCHPRLQKLAGEWLRECEKEKLSVAISETLRTALEQDLLYAQGRTRPGKIVTNAKGSEYRSQHQWGIAFDFYLTMDVNGDGKIADDSYNDSTGLFERAGTLAKKVGLAWGGDWASIKDKPHLYLPDWGSTPDRLIREYKTPEHFIKTWKTQSDEGFKMAKDGVRWWYQFADGTYASSGWHWLKEATGGTHGWYLFDESGYMLTGYQTDPAGGRYILCPDPGIHEGQCMISDEKGELRIAGEYDFENHRYRLS